MIVIEQSKDIKISMMYLMNIIIQDMVYMLRENNIN